MKGYGQKAIFVGLLSMSLGCEHGPPQKHPVVGSDIAPGNIIIEVTSPKTGGDKFWRYQVMPSRGQAIQVQAGRQTSGRWDTAAVSSGQVDCSHESVAVSPNQKFLARCFGELPGRSAQFTVTTTAVDKVVFRWRPANWRAIDGFVWFPTSRSIALLTHSEKHGTGLVELLWAGAGHPVPHDTFYLDVVDIEEGRSYEYVIRYDVLTGSGRILNWSP